MIDFNTEPYNDDFDENNKFHRILFRPSFAVQARELTQMQSILQNQIAKHGDHIFKEGAMVIPGQISYDSKADYVKLKTTYDGTEISTFLSVLEGVNITGTSGIQAQIIKVQAEDISAGDPPTIYIRYKNSATDNVTQVFAEDEVLTTEDETYTFQVASTAATGLGSIVSIERGVYYVGGNFVLVDTQSLILEKYSNTPSYRVGLTVVESIVTPEDDFTLLDNAQTSFNYAAPGAHRYYIDLTLSKLALTSEEDQNFIELLRVGDGTLEKQVDRTEYSVLEETFARRTYDESGDYTVREFAIDVREHRDNNRGAWVTGTSYVLGDVVTNSGNTYVAKNTDVSGSTAPTHTSGSTKDGGSSGVNWEYNERPSYNRGIYQDGDESKLAIGLEPGKAYVRGYEIEKIATQYVTINKARDFVQADNALIPATVGNYVKITNLNNLPPVGTLATVDLYSRYTLSAGRGTPVGTKIGTARVRLIDWDNGTIGSTAAVYKLSLFDIELNSGYTFDRHVKSFYYAGADAAKSFSADIDAISTQLIGAASASSSTTVTGVGTSFLTDLIVGDYVYLGSSLRRVTAIASQVSMTVDSTVTSASETISRVTTTLLDTDKDSLIFQLPYYAIKSLRNETTATNDTTYTVYETFTATAGSDLGTTCLLTVTTTSGNMASGAVSGNYILTDNTTGSIVLPTNIAPSGSSVVFTLSDTFAGRQFNVVCAVNKSGATGTEKTKTFNSGTIAFTTQATATSTILSLAKADVFRVISVKMKTGTFTSPGATYSIDITDRYTFDSGQRATHYDVGRLYLSDSYSAPTAPIEVTFEYFTHSTGDYFSVSSYPLTDISYNNIPPLLRDSLDFRPRINDAGTAFTGSGIPTLMLKRGIDIRSDFTYYLSRKEKIALDVYGTFFNISGNSGLNPGEPQDPATGMILYKLALEPYTFGTKPTNVVISKIDNKRYTMRDIGKLEKRIDNLEYYTSLSLLEQQTESLKISDNTGLDRLKNGFIVDNFNGHGVGNTASIDYLNSIDMEKGELRPFFAMDNVNLVEEVSSDSQRSLRKYQLNGDIITLPIIANPVLVKQEFASRTENINPFAIFTFIGRVGLNPPADEWFEVDRRPDLVTNVEGNFNTISRLAEQAGVLGTVWNAWQTQWTGTPASSGIQTFTGGNNWANERAIQQGATFVGDAAQFNARFGNAGGGGAPARQVVAETTAVQIGQSRTGVRTTVVANVDRQVVADRILSTAVIPFIRSRNILVQVRGLKPSTRFYPFFDDIDVTPYITPATKITYIPPGSTDAAKIAAHKLFDSEKHVGIDSTEAPRRIDGDSQVCLNKGEVITGSISGATGILVGSTIDLDTTPPTFILDVVNIKGTFQAAEGIVGSITASTGTVVSTSVGTEGGNLVSTKNGDINLLFDIPENDAVRFRTGTREFKLIDNTEARGSFTSRGRGQYRATGILETRQSIVNAVRNAELVEEIVQDSQVIVQTSERIISDTGWYDPLAQTFLIQNTGGAFLTSVDIYFASKDNAIPVTLEIREVVNGYPGKRVLPFSRVTLKPEQVNISSSTVDLDGVDTPSFDTPTKFSFVSPVYVQDASEYCIVLMSDSNGYNCWISNMGDTVPGTSRTISEQPYNGVLFKSQNASTWTANDMQDLKFTIYKAQFDISAPGTVQFVNDVLPLSRLGFDPFQITTGSNTVRIWQKNHGLTSGSDVNITNTNDSILTGIAATGTITTNNANTTVNGSSTTFETSIGAGTTGAGTVLYTAANVYVGVVESVTNDTTLVLVDNAAVTLSSATSFKVAAPIYGIPVTEIYTTQTVSNVDIDSYTITTTTDATASGYAGGNTVRTSGQIQYDAVYPIAQVQSFSDTNVVYQLKTTSGKSVDGTETPYVQDLALSDCLANENNYFYTPRVIASELTELDSVYGLNGDKSVTFAMNLSSTNDSLSPVIDTQRLSLVTISNKINSPTLTNTAVTDVDFNVVFTGATGAYSFSGSTITSTITAVRNLIATISIGQYIEIDNATTAGNDGRYLVTNVSDNGTTATITIDGTFATNESAVSATSVSVISLFKDEISPVGSSGISKYVTNPVKLALTSTFIKIRFSANVPSQADVDVYYKTTLGSTSALDSIKYTLATPDLAMVKVENGNETFYDVEYSIDNSAANLEPFDALQVKLVMRSTNTSAIPKIKDLRIVACA